MTLDQIESRLLEIAKEIETADFDALTALQKEADSLIEEREAIRSVEAKKAEIRTRVASGAAGSSSAPVVKPSAKAGGVNSDEYRSAWLKDLATLRDNAGNEIYRALGDMTAEERSAFTFTTANTGSVVPTVIANRIVELVESMSPIYNDATKSGMTQGFSLPRHTTINQGDAASTSEGVANDDEQDTFDTLTLTGVEIKKHVNITRKMAWQSIDAFETWLVQHLAARIAVAKDNRIISQLSDTTYGIESGNVLTGITYNDENIRGILALIKGTGRKVWYANQKTIFSGLAAIRDGDNRPLFLYNTTDSDPLVAGHIYGGIVRVDNNIPDDVVYVGVPKYILANDFDALFIGRDTSMTSFVTTIGAYSLFDAGLENPKSFVKVTFTSTSTPFISIPATATVAADASIQIPVQAMQPMGATISWTSGTTAKAEVDSNGVVTGKAAGTSVITASITVGATTYSDTCTVTVTS